MSDVKDKRKHDNFKRKYNDHVGQGGSGWVDGVYVERKGGIDQELADKLARHIGYSGFPHRMAGSDTHVVLTDHGDFYRGGSAFDHGYEDCAMSVDEFMRAFAVKREVKYV